MKHFLLSVMCAISLAASAQGIIVHETNNNQTVYKSTDVERIEFSSAVTESTSSSYATKQELDTKADKSEMSKYENRISELELEVKTLKEQVEALTKDTPTDPYDDHEYVDLGLPSGLKWATCNLGATNPEDYGKYYAWGETTAYGEAPSAYPSNYFKDPNIEYTSQSIKTVYDWAHYKYMTVGETEDGYCTKYTYPDNRTSNCWYNASKRFIGDKKTVLEPGDDAAHVNWGGTWRMPTMDELKELKEQCTWKHEQLNGVDGYIVVGPNGNSIFLPFSGYRGGENILYIDKGFYWSSSLDLGDSSYVQYENITPYGQYHAFYSRENGLTIRPVCP